MVILVYGIKNNVFHLQNVLIYLKQLMKNVNYIQINVQVMEQTVYPYQSVHHILLLLAVILVWMEIVVG